MSTQVCKAVVESITEDSILRNIFDAIILNDKDDNSLIKSINEDTIERQLGPGSTFLDRRCRSAARGADELAKQVRLDDEKMCIATSPIVVGIWKHLGRPC